jgi:hypothetical protein
MRIMPRPHRLLTIYVAALVATASIIAAVCLIANVLVDPLWYLHGNALTGVNFAFNERFAKLNQLLPRLREYDCLIMGSSRTTLLPERRFSGHHCFNLAFSGGRINEFLLYADYLRARGFAPSLLIVGVDPFDFRGPMPNPNVPDFVRTGANPPSLLRTYLSLDAFDFSIRTLEDDSPHHRYYDRNLNCRLEVRGRVYRPPTVLTPFPDPTEVHIERAALYVVLRYKFPTAHAIGYVPPVSAWTMGRLSLSGDLSDYLTALDRVAAAYDEFLDFGIPSAITTTTSDTADGSHYSETVNARIAAALQLDEPDPGVDWHRQSSKTIAALYRERLERLIASPLPVTGESENANGIGGPLQFGLKHF